jgi:beta-N-acetylhexosaminidase
MSEISRQAYSVLFPVVETLELNEHILRFLDQGGKSLLFGESGEEYVSGRLSKERLERETLRSWHQTIETAVDRGGRLILAADADIAAVHRLQGLATPLPDRVAAQALSAEALEEICFDMGRGVATVGVNLVLSPTADVVTGNNAWLAGRTLSEDPEVAAAIVRAYVRGVHRAGVKTTLKHFPGHPVLTGDLSTGDARVPLPLNELRAVWAPFLAGIEVGADAIMMGPARFDAVKPAIAGSLSADLIGLLRQELGFKGLVMTCDLDHKSTIGDASLGEVAVAALVAGADLLLLSTKAVPHLDEVAQFIVNAVERGELDGSRLKAAHAQVCAQAERRLI